MDLIQIHSEQDSLQILTSKLYRTLKDMKEAIIKSCLKLESTIVKFFSVAFLETRKGLY